MAYILKKKLLDCAEEQLFFGEFIPNEYIRSKDISSERIYNGKTKKRLKFFAKKLIIMEASETMGKAVVLTKTEILSK